MADIVLVLGGVRSGKSRFAQQLATALAGDEVLLVATAQAGDDEMRRRIERHKRDRPAAWDTIEVQRDIGAAIATSDNSRGAVIVDCLTLLVSNLLLAERDSEASAENRVEREIAALLHTCEERVGTVIIVSGEVGMGVVPDNELARRFRDLLGRANQHVAGRADVVYMMCAGLAIDARQHATTLEQAASLLQSRTRE